MRFAIVELAHGYVEETGRNFERLSKQVENADPGRWYNPVLVVIPKDREHLRFRRGYECELDRMYAVSPGAEWSEYDEFLMTYVVAVHQLGLGYGNRYRDVVQLNRERFRL